MFTATPCLLAADYTFGGDTTGATGVDISDSAYYVDTITTPANSGNLDSAIVWLDADFRGPHSTAIIIYNADSTILDSTAHFAVSSEGCTRYRADFIIGAAISASTLYFAGVHNENEGGTDGALEYCCNTGVAPDTWFKVSTQIPPTITNPGKTSHFQKAIMLFYSDAVTTTKKLGKAKCGDIKL